MKRLIAAIILTLVPTVVMAGYFGWVYSREEKVSFAGVTRRYRLHRPTGDYTNQKRPLVVALHGYGDLPWAMELYTGLSAKADREKFWVVYPYGTNGTGDANLSWNAGMCCGEALRQKVDDVEYVGNLITLLANKYPVDLNKVYITGFSNGAMLASRIIAETGGNKIKKAAIVAGAAGGSYLSSPYYHLPEGANDVELLLIHGREDKIVPFGGGPNLVRKFFSVAEFISFDETANYWVRSGGCEGELQVKRLTERITEKTYADCLPGRSVTTVEIEDLGHLWSGGLLEKLVAWDKAGWSATDRIWEFFEEN